ncbi:MAG: WecB/TagA/CpsF family glycosyltransferase [Limisphaerales bacterium]
MITSCDPDWEAVFESSEICLPEAESPPQIQPAPADPPVVMLGVPFDRVTLETTVRRIDEMIASRQPHYLVTANVDFLVQALHDVELRRILVEADLVLCDGTPLVWVSRWFGNPLPERVAGADLVPRLVRRAAESNYRLFFLGGAPEVTARAVVNLQNQYPRLTVAGHYSPPFSSLLEMDHQEIRRRIRAARPDVLFVSFGCPKAEKWMAMHFRSLDVPVVMGVGGTIDFLAGRLKRAPGWMQRTGLEWVFRLLQEPRRLLRRYVTDLWWFAGAVLRQWWRMRRAGWRAPELSTTTMAMVEPTWQRIRAPAQLDAATVHRDQSVWVSASPRHWLVEADQVRFIDSTGLGLLIALRKRLRTTGHELVLLAPSAAVQHALRLMRLEDFFLTAADASEARRLIASQESPPGGPNGTPPRLSQPLLWQDDITAANVERVWKLTQSQLLAADPGTDPMIIDLSAVRFIDCSGLGVMVRVKSLAAQQRRRLRFVGAGPNVRNVLRLARLESALLGEPS